MATDTTKSWSGGSVWLFIEEMRRYTRNLANPVEFDVGTITEISSKQKIKIKLSDSSLIYVNVGSTQNVKVGGLVLLLVKEDLSKRKTYIVQDIKYFGNVSDTKEYSV
jgi:hypothetical protein